VSKSQSNEAWSCERHDSGVSLLFVGKGHEGSRTEVFQAHTGQDLTAAWAKQVHGATVLAGSQGHCGDGDALITSQPQLPLSIATADCVPILLYGGGKIAAVHAGWRGLVAGIIGKTLDAMAGAGQITAWIGPAIGPCCYEVSPEVADAISASCDADIRRPGSGSRPHVDLLATTESQLSAAGVTGMERVPLCTRCETESLWSYRREGPLAGRNIAYAWIRADDE